MKLLFKEGPVEYGTYTFNYQPFIVRQSQDVLDTIYQQGGLPYSGDLSQNEDHFYMARSLRVDLSKFQLTSENRRILKKNSNLPVQIDLVDKEELINNEEFVNFCQHYSKERFSNNSMNQDRLSYVLNKSFLSHILKFSHDTGVYGYVFLVEGESAVHYRYSFLDTKTMHDLNLGKWIMTLTINYAKEHGYSYIYLGTCYQEKSLYKARDFTGIEYYTGDGWSNEKETLKNLCKNDSINVLKP